MKRRKTEPIQMQLQKKARSGARRLKETNRLRVALREMDRDFAKKGAMPKYDVHVYALVRVVGR